MKRAALYMRVSTLDQHPETQMYDLRGPAAQRGFEIVHEYIKTNCSGSKTTQSCRVSRILSHLFQIGRSSCRSLDDDVMALVQQAALQRERRRSSAAVVCRLRFS